MHTLPKIPCRIYGREFLRAVSYADMKDVPKLERIEFLDMSGWDLSNATEKADVFHGCAYQPEEGMTA